MATVQLAKIQNADGPDKDWRPEVFHFVANSKHKRAWRLKFGEGIQVFGEDGVRRTKGAPTTLRKVVRNYMQVVSTALTSFPDEYMLLAIIANESRGNANAERYEKRINDWSFGLCQLLTGTAYGLLKECNLKAPAAPIPKGGSVDAWRKFLCDPNTNIVLAASYLSRLNHKFKCKGDPILLYACYNAGSPRPATKNQWGLIGNDNTEPDTFDHIAGWYGDACYVVKELLSSGDLMT